jgi:hypothetical protein
LQHLVLSFGLSGLDSCKALTYRLFFGLTTSPKKTQRQHKEKNKKQKLPWSHPCVCDILFLKRRAKHVGIQSPPCAQGRNGTKVGKVFKPNPKGEASLTLQLAAEFSSEHAAKWNGTHVQ